MFDLWSTRREYFIECKYWSVDDDETLPNHQITHNSYPTGFFNAKFVGTISKNNQVLGELFMFPEKNITLETNDDVSKLSINDIVEYDGNNYRVDAIQSILNIRQSQFIRSGVTSKTFISLRG